jgi:hypothetical protein
MRHPVTGEEMRVEHSCSWCHAMNPTTRRYCRECGHEAHVARMECRCPKCVDGFRQALFPPKSAQE